MYRANAVHQLTDRIRRAYQRVYEEERTRVRLAAADWELGDLDARLIELEARVEFEQADLDEVRSKGLRSHVSAMLGLTGSDATDRRLRKEEQDLLEVALMHESAVQQRADAQRLRDDLAVKLADCVGALREADDATAELGRFVAATPDAASLLDADIAQLLDYMARLAFAENTDESPRSRAVAALRMLRGSLATTSLGDEPDERPTLTSRQVVELTEALDAAKRALDGLSVLRESLEQEPLRRGQASHGEVDQFGWKVVNAQMGLRKFIREITDVFEACPPETAFAETVFTALSRASEHAVTADEPDALDYVNEWIATIDRYVQDLSAKLAHAPR